MKKLPTIWLIIFLAFISCEKNFVNPEPKPITVSEQTLAAANSVFAIKMFKEMCREDKADNIFISPFSISMALSMANNGASGATRLEIFEALEQNGMTIEDMNNSYLGLYNTLSTLDQAVQFTIANSLWYRRGFNFEKSFSDDCQKYFKSSVNGLDFNDPSSVSTMNNWVKDNTKGKITKIVNDIDPLTMMYLINALYFKANWKTKFDPKKTTDGEFYQTWNSVINCKMMRINDSIKAFENIVFKAVEIPYGNSYFSMIIILPAKDQEINGFISQFTDSFWQKLLTGLKKENVNLILPKFKFDYETSLKEPLINFGMVNAFDPQTADFTNIAKNSGLFISDVIHKTYIDVNEEGSEAAAVTSIELGTTSVPEYFEMNINRPFIFVIRDNYSNSIEFIGKVSKPAY